MSQPVSLSDLIDPAARSIVPKPHDDAEFEIFIPQRGLPRLTNIA
jgi:hypothetical protein